MKKIKQEVKKDLPPLCAAVRKVRAAYGDTLERFAQRTSISLNTVSRFELGKAEPRDQRVLIELYMAAERIGLKQEMEEFMEASVALKRAQDIQKADSPLIADAVFRTMALEVPAYSLQQWRLMAAARTAALYYPDRATAMEAAAGPALAVVDDVLKDVDVSEGRVDYSHLDLELRIRAELRFVAELKQQKRDQ